MTDFKTLLSKKLLFDPAVLANYRVISKSNYQTVN